jgi:predicted HicB family RNase H-like nuclease
MAIKLHHGYTIRIYWSEETFSYRASCVEMPSINTQGTDRNSVLDNIDSQIESIIKISAVGSLTLVKPIAEKEYRGKIPLRVNPSTHRNLARLSVEEGISMNCLIGSILETNLKGLGREGHSMIHLEYSVNELKIIDNKLYNEIYSLIHTLKEKQE